MALDLRTSQPEELFHATRGQPPISLPSVADDLDPRTLYWFRWVTGHQTAFLYWICLAGILDGADQLETPSLRAVLIDQAATLLRGYSAMLVYSGSCPRELYVSTLRSIMSLYHRGFSGKWARDYRLIPKKIKAMIRQNQSDYCAKSASELRVAFAENWQVHSAIAEKLVPEGGSLRHDLQGDECASSEIAEPEYDRFDNFFLVRRGPIEPSELRAQLQDRFFAISSDITVNQLFPNRFNNAEELPPMLRIGSLCKYWKEFDKLLLSATDTALTVSWSWHTSDAERERVAL